MTRAFIPTATWIQLRDELERLVDNELLAGKVDEILAAAGVLPDVIRDGAEAAD